MSAAASVLRWYLVKYGGTRGPVAHLVVDYSSPTTVCGLKRPRATSTVLPRWGQPSREYGPGIALCKNCDRMKDASTMQPAAVLARYENASLRVIAAPPARGRVTIMAVQIEGEGAAVASLLASIGELVTGVRKDRT